MIKEVINPCDSRCRRVPLLMRICCLKSLILFLSVQNLFKQQRTQISIFFIFITKKTHYDPCFLQILQLYSLWRHANSRLSGWYSMMAKMKKGHLPTLFFCKKGSRTWLKNERQAKVGLSARINVYRFKKILRHRIIHNSELQ